MSGDRTGPTSDGDRGRHFPQPQQQQQHGSGGSPPPRSLSPTPVHTNAAQQLQKLQSPTGTFPQQPPHRPFSTSQPGSPTMYKVSPITRENSNNVSAYNPQSPYRSMAPTHSRCGDPSVMSSSNDQMVLSGCSELSMSSPQRFKQIMRSPPTSGPSLQTPERVRTSQLTLDQHPLQPITTADSALSQCGLANEAVHTPAGAVADDGFTTVLTNTNSQSAYNGPQSGQNYRNSMPSTTPPDGSAASSCPSKSAQGSMLTSPLTPASIPPAQDAAGSQQQQQQRSALPSRSSAAASSGGATAVHHHTAPSSGQSRAPPTTAEGNTILSSRPPENTSPALNSSPDSRLPLAARRQTPPPHQSPEATLPLPSRTPPAVAPQSQQQQQRESTPKGATSSSAASGASPAGVARASDSADRWVSPQRPPQDSTAQESDGVKSPGLARNAYADTPREQQQQQHSPAMYGVIGLPYTRPEAMASPSSTSRAPAIIKVRTTVSPQPQATDAQAHHHQQHADPMAAGVNGSAGTTTTPASAPAPVAAHPRSGSSDFSARYRKTIVRVGHGNAGAAAGPAGSSSSASDSNNNNQHNSTSRGTTATTCTASEYTSRAESAATTTTSPQTATPPPAGAAICDDANVRAGGEGEEKAQVLAAPQHITSVAPAAVVAARARAPVSTAAPAAVAAAVVDAVRKPDRRTAGGFDGATLPPVLTADTVLPVASQEEEARFSSSATDTTERSSSNSRVLLSTNSPSSSKAVKAASASGRSARLAQSTSNLSGLSARQKVSAQRSQPNSLAATYSGSNGSFTAAAAAAAKPAAATGSLPIGASPDVPRLSGNNSARRRNSISSASVSSVSSATPALASYSFVSSRVHLQRYIDQWRDRFEEDKAAYKEGGYLTVVPGKIVHSRYVLIQKLGWGEFSTVWLAYDTKHATLGRGVTQAFVAVKVAKCRSSVQEATHYEVSLLRYIEARLPVHAAVTNIVDCFDVQGEFGLHTCMVMPLCGPNLLSIIDRMKNHRGRRNADDIRLVKEIIVSVLISLHELSMLNVVHTDIKPENVLCCAVDSKLVTSMEKFCNYNKDRSHMISVEDFRQSMEQQSGEHLVCLADFGLSALLEPPGSAASWTSMCLNVKPSQLAPLTRCKKNFNVTKSGVMDNLRGTLIQTREYRAPEVLLGLDFTCATDVWSVGCMAFELITGNFLMDPKKKTREARDMDVEHLAMMMQLLGPLPADITNIRVRNNDYYDAIAQGTPLPRRTSGTRPPPEYLHRFIDRDGNFIYASRYRAYPSRSLDMELEPYLGFREARVAANFILSCLYSYDPKNRPSAKKLLGHPWFHGVGTVSKEKPSSR